MEQGSEGRRVHIGAGANLDLAADEIVQIVKVIDGLNRFRFADDPDLLAGWRSASNVFGPPRTAEKITAPDTPSSGGEGRSAA